MRQRKLGIFCATTLLLLTPQLVQKLTSAPAEAACCYFAAKDKDINQPGQKAFITWSPVEKKESFTVQPKFEGNAVDFGMVIPTPSRPKLDEMPRDFFKDLAIYTILMPLPQPIYNPLEPMPVPAPTAAFGGGAAVRKAATRFENARPRVVVVESGVVGSLDYKIIVTDDPGALFDWLKENRYSYGGDKATLDFYIKNKSFFTVMKIDSKQMKKSADGSYLGDVTPTRFTFASDKCIYPLKITQISVKDKTDALFYVQSPEQMDLPGDWSWQHSYRPMFLTYMLGCAANHEQQSELQQRMQWLTEMRKKDPRYETTKLEWAKQLGAADLSVLEEPAKNYGQMGTGDLPAGAKVITLLQFLAEVKADYLGRYKELDNYAKMRLAGLEDQYQPTKGMIVKHDPKSIGKGSIYTKWSWYPAREAPSEDVKGLARLKGHLQKGQWLTKFRKQIRKDEMTRDLVLSAVPKNDQQSYVRIMPTSPP